VPNLEGSSKKGTLGEEMRRGEGDNWKALSKKKVKIYMDGGEQELLIFKTRSGREDKKGPLRRDREGKGN